MPLPRKTMPKRLGKADGGGTSAKACSDSSQGKATVHPAPRSTARREMGSMNLLADMLVHLSGCYLSRSRGRWNSFVPELRAKNNGFHHRVKAISLGCQVGLHGIDQRFIGELQRAIERVTEQLAAKVVYKLILPVFANEIAQTLKANAVDVAGIGDGGIDGPPGQVFGAHIADGSVAFVGQAKRIKALMTGGAEGIGAMLGQHLADRKIGLRLIARQFGNHRWRRRNANSQHLLHHPIATLHRAGAEAG